MDVRIRNIVPPPLLLLVCLSPALLAAQSAGQGTGAVRCELGDDGCVAEASRAGKPVEITDKDGRVITDEQGEPVTTQAAAAARAGRPGEGVWRNYDFTPGNRVLRVVGFDSSAVGRFPAELLRFGRGTAEVVEFEGKRWLESKSGNTIVLLDLPETLGREFSLEFHLRIPTNNIGARVLFQPTGNGRLPRDEHYLSLTARPGVYLDGQEVSAMHLPEIVRQTLPVKLQVTDRYLIAYVGSHRVAMLPNATVPRSRTIEFQLAGNPRFPVYLGDIVVAVGLDDLGEQLAAGKPYTTRGIYFDHDSDHVRPESTRALAELVEVLTRMGTTHVAIEGHTDSQGDRDYNQQLSERRAAAVVSHLVAAGIDGSRLTAVGKGESEPVVPNDSPEHMQTNRRVVARVLADR
jgi:outer membrane protein OmpA-like peptidoglycan-associated protein